MYSAVAEAARCVAACCLEPDGWSVLEAHARLMWGWPPLGSQAQEKLGCRDTKPRRLRSTEGDFGCMACCCQCGSKLLQGGECWQCWYELQALVNSNFGSSCWQSHRAFLVSAASLGPTAGSSVTAAVINTEQPGVWGGQARGIT